MAVGVEVSVEVGVLVGVEVSVGVSVLVGVKVSVGVRVIEGVTVNKDVAVATVTEVAGLLLPLGRAARGTNTRGVVQTTRSLTSACTSHANL